MIQQPGVVLPMRPDPRAVITLLKPITWFPPMWAFGCGVVSVWSADTSDWKLVILGLILAGPLVCGTSQAVNDWFDRHVDAINEPGRPIPSGRIPNQWGLYIAIIWTLVSLAVAAILGFWVFIAAAFGLLLAWIYSAPPLRLKKNGWWGNSAVGICYEGLPWFTAAAVLSSDLPDWRIITLAALYSLGAHGIMTLNDFKSMEGDSRMGLRSIPVQLGVKRAALLACAVMLLPQIVVIALLSGWGHPIHAAMVVMLALLQVWRMRRLLKQPKELAPWYNATGVSLFVLGMLVSAFALQSGAV
ncbi:MAG: chlorophyll synthase ChlG [Pseudohongiellaceae bacterium]